MWNETGREEMSQPVHVDGEKAPMGARGRKTRREKQEAGTNRGILVAGTVVAVACVIAIALAVSRPRSGRITAVDPLLARADQLIAGLYCPCEGCGHSRFSQCGNDCGEYTSVRNFVRAHLRSGVDATTVLAHLKDRFGDLSTVASAREAAKMGHPPANGDTSSSASQPAEIPPELLQFLQQGREKR